MSARKRLDLLDADDMANALGVSPSQVHEYYRRKDDLRLPAEVKRELKVNGFTLKFAGHGKLFCERDVFDRWRRERFPLIKTRGKPRRGKLNAAGADATD
jgi:hypothetical protein